MHGGSFQRTATCYVTLFNILLPLFFSLFSSSPSPENYTVLGLAKFLATIRPYPFNTPLLSFRRRNETSVEKERKFYPRREHL